MTLASSTNGAYASPGARDGASSTLHGAVNGNSHLTGDPNGTSNRSPHTNGSSNASKFSSSSPIAIVGMSCKFAGDATNAAKFWDLCVAGKDSWTPIPSSRFNAEALYHPDGLRTGRVGCALEV